MLGNRNQLYVPEMKAIAAFVSTTEEKAIAAFPSNLASFVNNFEMWSEDLMKVIPLRYKKSPKRPNRKRCKSAESYRKKISTWKKKKRIIERRYSDYSCQLMYFIQEHICFWTKIHESHLRVNKIGDDIEINAREYDMMQSLDEIDVEIRKVKDLCKFHDIFADVARGKEIYVPGIPKSVIQDLEHSLCYYTTFVENLEHTYTDDLW